MKIPNVNKWNSKVVVFWTNGLSMNNKANAIVYIFFFKTFLAIMASGQIHNARIKVCKNNNVRGCLKIKYNGVRNNRNNVK